MPLQHAHAQTVLLSEDFQTGLPETWSTEAADSSSDGWRWGTALSLRSLDFDIPDHGSFVCTNEDACRFAGSPNCNKSSDRLIFPKVPTDGAGGLQFEADVYFYGAAYAGALESAALQIHENGLGWVDVHPFPAAGADQGWRRITMDLSPFKDRDSLELALVYRDGGGWPFGLAVDNASVRAIPELDLQALAWGLGPRPLRPFLTEGPTALSGTVVNAGSDTVQNFRIRVKKGGSILDSADLTGLNLHPLDTLHVEFPNPIVLSPNGDLQKMVVEIGLPNGSFDGNPTNNKVQVRYGAVAAGQSTARQVLLEHFTSTNCQECSAPNADYHSLLDASPVPANNLAYHVWWPYPTDPFFAVGERGVKVRELALQPGRAPALAINGRLLEDLSDLDAASLLEAESEASPWRLDGSLLLAEDGSMHVDARIEVLGDHWIQRSTLYAAISENRIEGVNPDLPEHANTETSFRDVFRRFLPYAAGTPIRDTLAGSIQDFSWAWDPSGVGLEWGLPGSTIDPLEQWALTLFLVDDESGQVLQSKRVAAQYPSSISEPPETAALQGRLWPNPSSDRLWLELDGLWGAELVLVEAFDALGRRCYAERMPALALRQGIDVHAWPMGQYHVRVEHLSGLFQRPFQVLR